MRGTGVTVHGGLPGPGAHRVRRAGRLRRRRRADPRRALARRRRRSPSDAIKALENGDRVTVPGHRQPARRAVGPAPAALGAAAAGQAVLARLVGLQGANVNGAG